MDLFKLAKKLDVEVDTTRRWENGEEHNPKSVELFKFLREIDENNGCCFDWRCGGDGDNGEELMYQLDVYFETLDKT